MGYGLKTFLNSNFKKFYLIPNCRSSHASITRAINVKKKLDLLRLVSSMDWGADRKNLLTLPNLDSIHIQNLRLALGVFRASPVDSFFAEATEALLNLRSNKFSL